MKICTKCKAEKAIDDFAVDRSKSDGHKSRCKVCDAVAKKKGYYAASPQARSSRTVLQRHRRWKDIAEKHGERWLIEQVQALKDTGRIPPVACDKAEQDDQLGAFFREADRASSDVLRTHLGARLWDRVARPFVAKAERQKASQENRERLWANLNAFNEASIVGMEWDEQLQMNAPVYDIDDGPTLTDHMYRDASDRILRKGRFASKK